MPAHRLFDNLVEVDVGDLSDIAAPAASVVDRAFRQLADAIGLGVYAAGEHLSEARLTQDIGISRGSLREAIRRLSAEGILEIVPNRGAIVRRITHEEVAEFFQLRGLYEGLAARRAAERIGEPGNRRLVAALVHEAQTLMEGLVQSDFRTHNANFHSALMAMSGGALLKREWERLCTGRQRLRQLRDLAPDNQRRALDDHLAILSAIMDGDGQAAERLGAAHVDIARRHVLHLPLAEFDTLVNGGSKLSNRQLRDTIA